VLRLFVTLSLAATLAAPPEDDRGRPVVLLVHGRGMVDLDTAATRKMWVASLLSGGKAVGGSALLTERDVRVVWYADVLDPRSSAGCDYAANDARARRNAATDPELKSLVASAGTLLDVLSGLISDAEGGSQLRALTADASFLSDTRKRCASEQRLGDAIDRARREGRPVILVAHSLGALVAYDYLSARSDTGLVQQFITIGSPAGSSELRRLLIGGDGSDSLSRPTSVASWTNIRNGNDLFAAPISVGRDVIATPPPDETDPHEMVGYLRGAVTAKEVLASWCSLYVSKAPSGCASLRQASP
jgi:pimeloyl-ACP methyl ester carboxylesterase